VVAQVRREAAADEVDMAKHLGDGRADVGMDEVFAGMVLPIGLAGFCVELDRTRAGSALRSHRDVEAADAGEEVEGALPIPPIRGRRLLL
jgi:hypothetical protein